MRVRLDDEVEKMSLYTVDMRRILRIDAMGDKAGIVQGIKGGGAGESVRRHGLERLWKSSRARHMHSRGGGSGCRKPFSL